MKKNQPYVKIYDENGVVINPITDKFLNPFPGRNSRRNNPSKRFRGNGKSHPLSVHKDCKYLRFIQCAVNKVTGQGKQTEHYILQ